MYVYPGSCLTLLDGVVHFCDRAIFVRDVFLLVGQEWFPMSHRS